MSQLDPHAQSLPDPRWARFRLIAVFVVLVVSLGSWLIFSRGRGNSPVEPVELSVLSLKDLYPEALSIAKEWQSNAFLMGADFTVMDSQNAVRIRAAFFFWGSSSDSRRWLNVYILETSPNLEIETDEGEFPPDRPLPEPIDPNELPFDSVDALETILDCGAAELLREHPNQPWPPGLILERSGPWLTEGPLIWRAYFTGEDIHDAEYFIIDAYTGELLE